MAGRGSTSASMCGSETAMSVTSRLNPLQTSPSRDAPPRPLSFAPRRKAALRPSWTWAATVCTIVATGGLAALVFAIGFLADASAAHEAALLPPGTVALFRTITKFGESGYLLLLSAGLIAVRLALPLARWRRRVAVAAALLSARATYFFVVIALSGVLAQLVKHGVGRARPSLMPQLGAYHFDFLSIRASLASFPSGHATTAFAAATALALFVPVWGVPLFAGATLIAASRIAIGAHYLSDVIAGSLLGISCAILIARWFARRGLVFEDGAGLAGRGAGVIFAVLRQAWLGKP